MKKLKVNGIEIEIEDGMELVVEDEGKRLIARPAGQPTTTRIEYTGNHWPWPQWTVPYVGAPIVSNPFSSPNVTWGGDANCSYVMDACSITRTQ